MRPHVHHPVPRTLERLLADRARVRLHAGVRRHVRHENVGARETAPALLTAIRAFPSVSPHVGREVAKRAKRSPAVLAYVRLGCQLALLSRVAASLAADVVCQTYTDVKHVLTSSQSDKAEAASNPW